MNACSTVARQEEGRAIGAFSEAGVHETIGEMHSPALDKGRRRAQPRYSVRSISINLLASLLYAFFLYSAFKFWLRTGSLVHTGIVLFNTILIICLLCRRHPLVTGSAANWVLAPLSQVLPMLVRPVVLPTWAVIAVSSAGQVLGLGIMIASLISLNRSMGIVAANRGIKTRGLYGWVRHPLYAGEILFFISFLASNWSLQNAALVALIVFAQIVRASQEERLLLQDPDYRRYSLSVRHRFVPGVV